MNTTLLTNPNVIPLLQTWLKNLQAIDNTVAAIEWEQKYDLNIPANASENITIPRTPWNYIRFNHMSETYQFASYITISFGNPGITPELECFGPQNPYVLILPDQYQQVITITNTENSFVSPQQTVIGNLTFGFIRRKYQTPFEAWSDT